MFQGDGLSAGTLATVLVWRGQPIDRCRRPSLGRGGCMLEDVQYAFRQARKAPGFAVAAITTLALGIGAAAAMFVLVQGVLLSPPPYAKPDRLVFLTPSRVDGQPYLQGASVGQWMDWRSSATTIEPPALYRWTFNFLVLP